MPDRVFVRQTDKNYFFLDERMRAAFFYALALIACLLALDWVLRLKHDLSIPFSYSGDGLISAALIKGIIENGWYVKNGYLGAPNGLNMLDFPLADNLHFALIKAISLFTGNYVVAMNLFFLATFPLTVITSLFVFRRLKISFPVAVVGSILFTFLPYHFSQGEGHLFLSGIYIIPLSLLMVFRLFSHRPPLIKTDDAGKEKFDWRSRRTIGYGIVALLTASAGIYYAFFACFFLVVAGLYAAFARKSPLRMIAAGYIAAIIAIGVVANISPSLIYQHNNGKNEAVGQRLTTSSMKFGMTFSQLVMPVRDHRVEYLRDLKTDFNKKIKDYVNENDYASLGLLGSLGLLFSLGWLLYGKGRRAGPDGGLYNLLDGVSVLSIMAILLGTIGGISLLFSFFVSPQIRAYNRISIFIGFFSILAVLALLEILRQKMEKSGRRLWIFYGVLLVIVAGGLFDQTTMGMVPAYESLGQKFASDEAFIQRVEGELPKEALVFQLPYAPFPESPAINKMTGYDHLRGYLHSRTIHWSYGAMNGRQGDQWQKEVAAKPAGPMLKELAQAGFSGVYINRSGYADGAAKIERELRNELGAEPIVNEDNSLLFFKVTG